jgi:hypothetical protein
MLSFMRITPCMGVRPIRRERVSRRPKSLRLSWASESLLRAWLVQEVIGLGLLSSRRGAWRRLRLHLDQNRQCVSRRCETERRRRPRGARGDEVQRGLFGNEASNTIWGRHSNDELFGGGKDILEEDKGNDGSTAAPSGHAARRQWLRSTLCAREPGAGGQRTQPRHRRRGS